MVVEAIELPGAVPVAQFPPYDFREVHMLMTLRSCLRQARWAAAAAGLLLTFLAAVACGSAGEGEAAAGFQKTSASDSVFAIEDFLSIGFKKNKQYNVEELPAGVDAWTGFWGPDPYSRKDYELRFYASHGDAVEYGPALAEEVAGENAEAFRKDPNMERGRKGPLAERLHWRPGGQFAERAFSEIRQLRDLRERADAVRRWQFRAGAGTLRSPGRRADRRGD